MISTLVRLIIAAEVLAGAAAGYALATQAGAGGWALALAIVSGAALMPVLLHALAIGVESLSAAWWRRRTFDHIAGLLDTGGPRPAAREAAGLDAVGAPGLVASERTEVGFDRAAATGTRAALAAWVGETAASLQSFFLLMPWLGRQSLPSGNDPARLPVVLVHGYFCNRAIWRPMARWLAARGHALESPNLEPPFAGIDDFLPSIDAAVERLRARTGAPRIGLVGHSLGSLVIRRWLCERGDADVAAIVTLGAPHQGTWSARFGLGDCVVQMRPDNPWLLQLAATETPPMRERFTTVLTLHDNIVMPQVTQTMPDARVVVLAGLGHLQLTRHSSVRPFVAAALDRAMSEPLA